ncbi:hypothetical protein C8F04DRAFT_1191918 [Mycena alexandri]|uniref:Uncharacterized protein n=1 Tax=Mycena alexandri TaxID=1745969 RepID=A0AAD6SC47_9AGAR|nr:hypothetical protein C8F04DRAFT_1191918 [Mycena alexandri]
MSISPNDTVLATKVARTQAPRCDGREVPRAPEATQGMTRSHLNARDIVNWLQRFKQQQHFNCRSPELWFYRFRSNQLVFDLKHSYCRNHIMGLIDCVPAFGARNETGSRIYACSFYELGTPGLCPNGASLTQSRWLFKPDCQVLLVGPGSTGFQLLPSPRLKLSIEQLFSWLKNQRPKSPRRAFNMCTDHCTYTSPRPADSDSDLTASKQAAIESRQRASFGASRAHLIDCQDPDRDRNRDQTYRYAPRSRAASGCERERPNKSVLREVYAAGGKSPLVNASVQCSKSTKGEGSIGAISSENAKLVSAQKTKGTREKTYVAGGEIKNVRGPSNTFGFKLLRTERVRWLDLEVSWIEIWDKVKDQRAVETVVQHCNYAGLEKEWMNERRMKGGGYGMVLMPPLKKELSKYEVRHGVAEERSGNFNRTVESRLVYDLASDEEIVQSWRRIIKEGDLERE